MMDNRDLKRNASGYYDETPYKALTTSPKPGDVWARQDGANMLVVAVNGSICNTLRMNDTPKDAASIPVKLAAGEKWVNAPYIGFIRSSELLNYECRISDEELEKIKIAVGEALDLYDEDEEAEEVTEKQIDKAVDREESNEYLTNELIKLKVEYGELDDKCAALELDLQQTLEKAVKLEAYREMYENLLDKVIGRAG